MERICQMNFEFNQWEEVFKVWKDNLKIYGDEMQLVISTNPYTSGYWIEYKGATVTKGDKVYVGKQVLELEKRIIKEHQTAKKEERGVHFVS